MSVDDRVITARARIKSIVDRTSRLVALHENNSIVTYTDTLSKQIPPSRAGHAYNLFRDALFNYEIVSLCSIWDRPDPDLAHQSIPTAHILIDDGQTLEQIITDVRGWYARTGARKYRSKDDPLSEVEHQKIIDSIKERWSESDAHRAEIELRETLDRIKEISRSPLLTSVRNIRDKYLAHGLEATRAERRGEVVVMKYGDEKQLLSSTVEIVQKLYQWVNGVGFDLGEVAQLNHEYAEELWGNCRFDIPAR